MTTFDPVPLNLAASHDETTSGEPLRLTCTFDLDPIGEMCLRLFLHMDSAPLGTTVEINRWHVGVTLSNQPFSADVTDYVTLDANVLLLQVNRPGKFGAVWLERVPCEEIG